MPKLGAAVKAKKRAQYDVSSHKQVKDILHDWRIGDSATRKPRRCGAK